MFRIIETLSTAILLVLIMILVLHLIRGDALEWIGSKFQIGVEEVTKSTPSPQPPSIPNDPLPPPPSNQG